MPIPITMPSSSRMKRQHKNVATAGTRSISEKKITIRNEPSMNCVPLFIYIETKGEKILLLVRHIGFTT